MTDYRKNFVIGLVSYAIQKDISAPRLCQLSGIDLQALQSLKKMEITSIQLDRLWRSALDLGGDPLFGLHYGETMQISALGIIGTIIRNSLTIGNALQQCAAFTWLLTDLFDMKVTRSKKEFTIRLIPFKNKTRAFPLMQKQTMDLSMAFILHELDGLLLTKMKPERVIIPHHRKDRTEYERVLRCRKVSNGDGYLMEFDNVLWDEPILSANYQLQSLLLQYAEQYKYPMDGAASMAGRVANLLRKNTYLGIPALKEIAANLHVSARSLQRRLKEEGVTYQELAGSVRKTMAMYYLDSGHHQVGEIAYILGYHKLSAFTRAFKGWTGLTPQEYKKASVPEPEVHHC